MSDINVYMTKQEPAFNFLVCIIYYSSRLKINAFRKENQVHVLSRLFAQVHFLWLLASGLTITAINKQTSSNFPKSSICQKGT